METFIVVALLSINLTLWICATHLQEIKFNSRKKINIARWCNGNIPDSLSGAEGSIPSFASKT